MAINPVAAKLLAKIAVDTATDKEKGRKILWLFLAPIVTLLLLIAFIVYLMTSPLSIFIEDLLPDEIKAIEDFQKGYGYNQTIGIYEKDYLAGSGIDYGDIIFMDGFTPVVYFNQLDERYANEPYGTDEIGSSGCGPTALSIVISSLTDQIVDPIQMAEWSVANGGWCEGNGSYHSLIPNAAKAFGLEVEGDVQNTPQKIIDALSSGKLVIALMSKGHFTSGGHYIVLRGVTADGKILVADPASRNRSEQEWEFQIFLDECRKGAAAGGPFWIIGQADSSKMGGIERDTLSIQK